MSAVSKKAAFTLIELLVVISIILIATSVLFVGGGGGGDGVNLSSAQRIVSSMAQGVRQQALLKNQRARLIIYSENNTEEPDKILRYFGVVYEDPDPDNEDPDPDNPGQWIAASQGTSLPEGIYFDPGLSSGAGKNWSRSSIMKLEYPLQSRQPDNTGPEYYYYEFNPNGTMATDFENSWLVIRAGTLKPDDSGNLTVDFDGEDKENLKAALIFRRVGSTTLVSDPTEIETEP